MSSDPPDLSDDDQAFLAEIEAMRALATHCQAVVKTLPPLSLEAPPAVVRAHVTQVISLVSARMGRALNDGEHAAVVQGYASRLAATRLRPISQSEMSAALTQLTTLARAVRDASIGDGASEREMTTQLTIHLGRSLSDFEAAAVKTLGPRLADLTDIPNVR